MVQAEKRGLTLSRPGLRALSLVAASQSPPLERIPPRESGELDGEALTAGHVPAGLACGPSAT
jgi:hypothetical protein